MARNAIGVVRVSQMRGRDPDISSPADQRRRIEEACKRDDLKLLSVVEELDVSGGSQLDRRAGLTETLAAVEAGDAQVVVVAWFDRLFRSLAVQAEVVSRVEKAGGEVLALDFGKVSEASAAQWLSGTMMGAFAEYYRRSVGERLHSAQAAAVKRGVAPFPSIPAGLERGGDGRLVTNADAPAVVEAFRMRASGETIDQIRSFLASRGIKLTYRGVQGLLGAKLLLGEIHFGDLVNREAHEPVIERQLWDEVQNATIRRGGRPAKSDRLLARLGILRCATCKARMVVATSHHSRYWVYRCPPVGDCERRVSIAATIAESVVVEAAKRELSDIEGRASAESESLKADAERDRAQAALDSAIRAFAGLEDERAARERLAELRLDRDAAVGRSEQLGGLRSARVVGIADWDALTLEGQRAVLRATIEAAYVSPGRGADRITVVPFGQ